MHPKKFQDILEKLSALYRNAHDLDNLPLALKILELHTKILMHTQEKSNYAIEDLNDIQLDALIYKLETAE